MLSSVPGSLVTSMSEYMTARTVEFHLGEDRSVEGRFLGGIRLFTDTEWDGVCRTLLEEGTHKRLRVSMARANDLEVYRVQCYCPGCQDLWIQDITMHLIHESQRITGPNASPATRRFEDDHRKKIIRSTMVPYFARIAKSNCIKLQLQAQLAEWITLRLAAAGDEGCFLEDLAHEGARTHECTPEDVLSVIDGMGFVRGMPYYATRPMKAGWLSDDAWPPAPPLAEPVVRLPDGHPLRGAS